MAGSRPGGARGPVYHRRIPPPRRTPSPWQRTPDDVRPVKDAVAWTVRAATPTSSSWFFVVGGKKPAVAAAGKQQRFLAIIGIGLDGAEENDMVAPVIAVDGATLKIRNALGEKRRA